MTLWSTLGRTCSLRLSRAEKSEVLTADLAVSERRVEALRVSCGVIRKRLAESLSGHGSDDSAKRLRKIPEHQLGAAMKEGAGFVGQETLLGAIMQECGEAQTRLAQERLAFEQELETTVLDNSVLQQLLESDIPNVNKLRKTLAKLTLDMDASRSRHQAAQRHTAGAPGATGAQQKVETTREELETAQIKVEQHRDTLAGDMFQLLSREPELAQLLLQLVKLQTEHYRSGLQLLEATIPGLQASLNAAAQKPVFGLSLEEHLRLTDRQVALPLEMCVCRLLQIGAEEEGLFRVAGSTSKARKLKSCFDAGLVDAQHMLEYSDPHVVADALKAYLRDLPEPLMTTDSYDDWMVAARVQDEGQRLQALWQVLHQLPETHYANMQYLIKFLAVLCKNKQVNKMTTQNMAIVMAPNLLWTRLEEGFNMTATGTHSLVVDALIGHADWFFPDEVEFFITYPREPAEAGSAPDSPELSNGSVRLPGHHRSKSSDSGVIAVDSSAPGESTGSTASLTSDSSPLHCESPRPTLRRKKQAAPPPPAHRQTIGTVPRPKPGDSAAPAASHVSDPPPPPAATAAEQTHAPQQSKPIGFEPLMPLPVDSAPAATAASAPGHSAAPPPVLPPPPAAAPSTSAPTLGAALAAPVAALASATVSAAAGTKPDAWQRPAGGASAAVPVACPMPPPAVPVERPAASAERPTQSGQPPAAGGQDRSAVTGAGSLPLVPSVSTPVVPSVPAPVVPPVPAPVVPPVPAPVVPPVLAPVVPPVPAPRSGTTGTPTRAVPPLRPPPPAKALDRAQSFSPSDGGGAQRQKPALPERPGTLKRPRNSIEGVKDSVASADPSVASDSTSPAGAPPPIGWTPLPTAPTAAAEVRPRPRAGAHPAPAAAEARPRPRAGVHPTAAPPPVPAPRTDSTHL